MINEFSNIDYLELARIVPRSLISLITLFLITKLIGKKQVSELSLFDYVIGISIGNFTAEMTMAMDGQYLNGVVAIIVFGLFAYLVSLITMKSITLRRIIIGIPSVLVEDGQILVDNLKHVNIDINEFLEQCRSQGYFDLSEISYAIMESNGKLSILPKAEYKPVTIKDMKLKYTKENLTSNVIIDGKFMKNNIKNTEKSIDWIKHELKVKGYTDMSNIILATLKDNTLTVYEKNKGKDVKKVLE